MALASWRTAPLRQGGGGGVGPAARTAAPRPLVQCRVARPSAVLDRPQEAAGAPAEAQAPNTDRPRRPRRRSSRPPPRRSAGAAASAAGNETSDDDHNQDEQIRQEGPTFTPVESAASLILRGLRQPALVPEGEGEGDGNGNSNGNGNNDATAPATATATTPPPSVPLAVEGPQGLAVAVLALSRAQHALRTERGLELVIEGASTRRGRGPTRNTTSLRARLRASPAQAPTDRPVRRVDVVPGTPRNSVVAAAVDALRAAHPAPVDLIARGPRAASNALAALGLVRATMLSGAAAFTPAPPPPWVAARRGGGGEGQGTAGKEGGGEEKAAPATPATPTPRPPPAFPPLDVAAVLDALPPARPSAVLAAADASAVQLPPHELVVRLRLITGPPPPPRAEQQEAGERRPARGRRAAAAAAASDAPAAAAADDGGDGDNDGAPRRAGPRRRRSRSATRREKQSAVAELRAAAADGAGGGGGGGAGGGDTASLRRELAELGERVRDLAKMNAVVLDLLEKEKRR